MDLSCHFSNFFRFRFLFNVGDEKSFCTQLRPLNRHAKIIMWFDTFQWLTSFLCFCKLKIKIKVDSNLTGHFFAELWFLETSWFLMLREKSSFCWDHFSGNVTSYICSVWKINTKRNLIFPTEKIELITVKYFF